MSPILDIGAPVPVGIGAELVMSIAVMEAVGSISTKFLGILDSAIRISEDVMLTKVCHASGGVQVGVQKSRGATEERQKASWNETVGREKN